MRGHSRVPRTSERLNGDGMPYFLCHPEDLKPFKPPPRLRVDNLPVRGNRHGNRSRIQHPTRSHRHETLSVLQTITLRLESRILQILRPSLYGASHRLCLLVNRLVIGEIRTEIRDLSRIRRRRQRIVRRLLRNRRQRLINGRIRGCKVECVVRRQRASLPCFGCALLKHLL